MKIVVIGGAMDGLEYPVDKKVITLGRHPDDNVFLPFDHLVSRHHARLTYEDGQFWIEDVGAEGQGSRNGTYIRGKRITPLKKVRLSADEPFILGRNTVLKLALDEEEYKRLVSILPEEELPLQPRIKRTIDPKKTHFLDLGLKPPATTIKDYYKKLAIVHRIGNALGSIFDLSRLLDAIMENVFEAIPAERGYLFLMEWERPIPKVIWRRDKAEETKINISKTILNKVLREKKGVLTFDALGDERFKDAASIIKFNIRSAMCVPLLTKEEVLGAIYLDTLAYPDAFDEEDLELLTGIANQAALAIHNARLSKRIEDEAAIRSDLGRYLPPQLVELVINKKIRLALGGKTREVTLLYSDIRGFTALSEEMEPEEIVGMLSEYFTEMTKIVFKYNGTVDSYTGDAILAVFGSPVEDKEQTEKAVLAALEMQEAIRDLNKKRREKGEKAFQIGIGVNYGKVVHGNVGSKERMLYTVVGDAVNTTQRIAAQAEGGTVLISESTEKRIKGKFLTSEQKPIEVKGKKRPISVYEIKGLKE